MVKEFISAVEDLEIEDQGGKVPLLDGDGSPISDESGQPVLDDPHVTFKLNGRLMRAYPPNDGQLAFMLASLGRGQTDTQRMASMINLMMSSLRNEDADFFESGLLARDPKDRIGIKAIEEIFGFLIEEWFARPTQPQSASVSSPPSDGTN